MLHSSFDISLHYYKDDYPDNQSLFHYSLDDSFSLNFSKDNPLKNYEISESQLQANYNKCANIEGDKECSPAPAPLRSSSSNINQPQNQNELSSSHNMECPEVVNKALNTDESDLKTKELINIFNANENTFICDESELIEKPFDNTIYLIENELNSDLENKSAAVNVIPINDNLNSPPNKISNDTPLDNKNKKIKEKIFFINTKVGKTNKNRKGYVRKLKPDSLRKKIKARFHKKLRQIINIKLKECGSIFEFDLFPQSFITNINIDFNKPLLNITMRELFQKTFGFKAKDREKINYNIRVIKYIEENPHLNNDDKISKFLDCTYEETIQKYMFGDYLLEDVERLKKEGENSDYINRYIFIAMHWIDFYKNGKI